jgi:uracil-DNA glycosylase
VSATAYLPERLSLRTLRAAAAECEGCDLYKHATQTVFGEGRAHARFMMVGEQPGDSEDRAGHPFVGPAGRVLHEAMALAGISRDDVYVTNVVKHFKFIERGKRRIHQKPKTIEIRACRPWLEAEIEVVRPGLVVALGATAAQAFFGSGFRLLANRGRVIAREGPPPLLVTIHPSAVLRAPDSARHAEMEKFVADLRVVRSSI